MPAIINNWDSPHTIEAWEFIADVSNSVNFGRNYDSYKVNVSPAHYGLYEGTTLMTATMYPQSYNNNWYAKNIQINWVPYPKSTNAGGQEICQYYGLGMALPKVTTNESNVKIALKFMELWATRYTEALFDNLNTFEYYNFNYKQRKQYFDFVTKNVVFGISMNDFDKNAVRETNFFECFLGENLYNVRTEAAIASKYVYDYIIESMEFGNDL